MYESERTGKARALSCPQLCGRLRDDGYCFAVSKLSGRIEIVAMALSYQSPADVSSGSYDFTVSKLNGRIGR